ncbi:MAG: RDD family protein [Bacteroidetes bacterium]|nr:RDD family protein [Bacteroidota bacterium]MBS1540606.1 RDD family protein [Bacteroidota bacterium]
MNTVGVRTTQNVIIQYPVASVGERILAYLVDRIIQIIYIIAIATLFIRLGITQLWIWITALLIPVLLFRLVFEIFMNGQTPGKRLLKIQVVSLNGTRASIGGFILRWIFSLIDFGVLGGAIAVIIVAAGGKGQRLGDVVAGTTVVKLAAQQEVSANQHFITADENYIPSFAQAIQLSSHDIELMKRALEADELLDNPEPLLKLIEKIKNHLGIVSDLSASALVRTLIKDHSHLTSD